MRTILFYAFCFGVLHQVNSALLMPFIRPEAQSNIVVKASFDHPVPTPPYLTNLLTNTNLFSPAELDAISTANQRFSSITNIYSVAGLKLIKTNQCYYVVNGWLTPEGKYEKGPFTNFFTVAVHSDSEHQETVEIAEPEYPGGLTCRVRRPNGEGYNVGFAGGSLVSYAQVKNQRFDGLYVLFILGKKHVLPEQCYLWTRFKHGMAGGDFLTWNGEAGQLNVWAVLPEGFDFIGNCVDTFDPAWSCESNP